MLDAMWLRVCTDEPTYARGLVAGHWRWCWKGNSFFALRGGGLFKTLVSYVFDGLDRRCGWYRVDHWLWDGKVLMCAHFGQQMVSASGAVKETLRFTGERLQVADTVF